jgi:hypothetical protein
VRPPISTGSLLFSRPSAPWSPPVSTSATTCARWTTLASLIEVFDRG